MSKNKGFGKFKTRNKWKIIPWFWIDYKSIWLKKWETGYKEKNIKNKIIFW